MDQILQEVLDSNPQESNVIKSMAQLMLALSQVIVSRSPVLSGLPNRESLSVPAVYMKNGTQKPKTEISMSMKRWMNREILKVPWLGLLHFEMRKAIENQ